MPRTLNLEAREKILKSALGLIHARGFRDVSMEDMAEAAGLKKANLFHYYPSKEDLGLAALDFAARPMRESLADRFSRGAGDPIKTVEGMFSESSDEMHRHGCHKGCLMGNLAQEMSDLDEKMRRKIEEHFRFWTAQIADCLERGKRGGYFKPSFDPQSSARAVLSLFEGAMTLCKTMRDAGPMEDARHAAAAYLKGFKS